MKTYEEKIKDEFLIAKEVSGKIQKLGKLNNLGFTKYTLFSDARKSLAKVYPELDLPDEYFMRDYNKELDKLMLKLNIS